VVVSADRGAAPGSGQKTRYRGIRDPLGPEGVRVLVSGPTRVPNDRYWHQAAVARRSALGRVSRAPSDGAQLYER
jgi:hypothetical protein